ncbi:hypothetical protein Godav_024666 [Gossypium davidsonii]|uniref:Uncharacterized protein n=1 Tax=Gossypium davidsonii TaxID=34287 RepID=A0A7J8TD52_GOSDV|nr:hypothetical protein [Gossypium davidsonii]
MHSSKQWFWHWTFVDTLVRSTDILRVLPLP